METNREERRLALNEANKNNTRLNLKLSKKNFKKLKIFQEAYNKKIESLVVEFYTDIASRNITLNDDLAGVVFDKFNRDWKNWARHHVTKLNLHSKEGRQEVFARFEEVINKALNEAAAEIKEEEKNKTDDIFSSEQGVELVTLAINAGATKDSIKLDGCKDNKEIVQALKDAVPKGSKLKFEKKAKEYLKKLGKS